MCIDIIIIRDTHRNYNKIHIIFIFYVIVLFAVDKCRPRISISPCADVS